MSKSGDIVVNTVLCVPTKARYWSLTAIQNYIAKHYDEKVIINNKSAQRALSESQLIEAIYDDRSKNCTKKVIGYRRRRNVVPLGTAIADYLGSIHGVYSCSIIVYTLISPFIFIYALIKLLIG